MLFARHAGDIPAADELAASGIDTFVNTAPQPTVRADAEDRGRGASVLEQYSQATQPLAAVGPGLPAVSKRLMEKIRANEYVDFAELPPAKGKSRPISQALDGQVLVVQAADLLQTRKVIPDFATWSQCFALYAAILAPQQPTRIAEFMAYQSIIAKASKQYKWPAWVVYDQNFRQEAAGDLLQSWAKVDPSIYALCFTGQAASLENWCTRCQCLDHSTANCPAQPSRKRSWAAATSSPVTQYRAGLGRQSQEQQICIKFNKFDGDCRFGRQCKFMHVCSACREPHPMSRCKKKSTQAPAADARET